MVNPSSNPEMLVHYCDTCGYELTGLKSRGECPECGAAFNAARAFKRERVNLALAFARMTLPPLPCVFVFALLVPHMPDRPVAMVVGVVDLAIWLAFATLIPLDVASRIADRRWTRPRRQVPLLILFFIGLALNLGIMLAVSWLLN